MCRCVSLVWLWSFVCCSFATLRMFTHISVWHIFVEMLSLNYFKICSLHPHFSTEIVQRWHSIYRWVKNNSMLQITILWIIFLSFVFTKTIFKIATIMTIISTLSKHWMIESHIPSRIPMNSIENHLSIKLWIWCHYTQFKGWFTTRLNTALYNFV